jgi:magnesium transporter
MPYSAYYLATGGEIQRDLTRSEIESAFASGKGLLWVDITEPTEDDSGLLEQVFKFHHLAIEDAVSREYHPPKIDDFESYLFIIVHSINYMAESDVVDTAEVAFFLGTHFVVSVHTVPFYSIQTVVSQVEDNGRPMKRGADFLVHALIDGLIDNILPTIDRMNEVADEIEEEAIRTPQQATLEAIVKLKRSTLRIHRTMSPQREVLNRLSRGEFPLINREAEIFYHDVYDHLVRNEDLNGTLRERCDNILTTYLSSIANKQNETMRVLSIVATIFMPLTLLTGIYGMNFKYMPELSLPWGYYAVVGFIGVAILGLVLWFWARNWITWGRKVTGVRTLVAAPEKLIGYVGQLTKFPRSNRQ